MTAAVAILALLSHVIFPLHALAAAGAPSKDGLVPICTSKGIVWVQLEGKTPERPQDLPADQTAGQPCHYCAKHTSQVALPASGGEVIKMWLAAGVSHPSSSEDLRSRATERTKAIRAPPA